MSQIDYLKVLESLHKINEQILSSTQESDILQNIVDSARNIFSADSCNIQQYDEVSKTFKSQASSGLSRGWKHLPRKNGIGMKVLVSGKKVWERDQNKFNPATRKFNIKCIGVFALHRLNNPPIGILILHFKNNPNFSENDEKIGELFAYHAGLAIRISELLDNNIRRINDLKTLRDASIKIVETGSLKESLKRIVTEAKNVTKADCAILFLCDDNSKVYIRNMIITEGVDPSLDLDFPTPRKNGLTQTILNKGIIWQEDLDNIPEDRKKLLRLSINNFFKPQNLRSFIGVALKSRDEALGILYVCFKRKHIPDEDQLSTLQIFAHHAATRIQLAKLDEAQKRAVEAERIRDLGVVAAQFAHRIINVAGIMPIILNDIESIIKNSPNFDALLIQRLNHLSEGTKRLMEMGKLLRSGGNDLGQALPLNLEKIVDRAVKARNLDSNCSIIVDVPKNLKPVIMDEILLIEILVNLLDNAADANATFTQISVTDRSSENEIDLHIKDNGKGITEKELGKIFMPLYASTRSRKTGGMHLGLWASRCQINHMGGSMTVISDVGMGTTFTITLKVAKKDNIII